MVETRIIGKRARPLDHWSIPLPPEADNRDGGGLTLRELISRIVRAEVQAFERRERARRLVRVLSDREIAESAAKGKIDSGGSSPTESTEPTDEESAVAVALQGFEDGLYLVILDGEEQRDLDRQVFVSEQSRMTFLRLTFLAGA